MNIITWVMWMQPSACTIKMRRTANTMTMSSSFWYDIICFFILLHVLKSILRSFGVCSLHRNMSKFRFYIYNQAASRNEHIPSLKLLTGYCTKLYKCDELNKSNINISQDDKVFSYYNHTLEEGFPLEIQQVFPGVPSHLDAAVECPQGECTTDSVLFFKGE